MGVPSWFSLPFATSTLSLILETYLGHRQQPLVVLPILLLSAILVVYGSRITRQLVSFLTALIVGLSLAITIPVLVAPLLPSGLRYVLAVLVAACAGAAAGRSAYLSESTVALLAFFAGVLAAPLVGDFRDAAKLFPVAGPVAAAISFGTVFSWAASFAPAHAAAASTAIIGARGVAACLVFFGGKSWSHAEAFICLGVAIFGYIVQVCVVKRYSADVGLPYSRIG